MEENHINTVLKYLNNNQLSLFLEGLISAGKSTLCKSIEYYLSKYGIVFNIYPEPINQKLLDLFYTDIKTHAFSFQSITIRERVHLFNDALTFLNENGKGLVMIDRSSLGDCAFALMHHKSGNISDQQFVVYADLTKPKDNVKTKNVKKVIVNLECTPEKARERVIYRGKENEINSCTVEYLSDLKKSYHQVFTQNGSIIECEVIKQIYDSMGINLTNIINIDYNKDYQLVNGILSEGTTFEILYNIINTLN